MTAENEPNAYGTPKRPNCRSEEFKALKRQVVAAIAEHHIQHGPHDWHLVYLRPEFEPICQRGVDPLRSFWRWVTEVTSPMGPNKTRPKECRSGAEAVSGWAREQATDRGAILSERAWHRRGANGEMIVDLAKFAAETFEDTAVVRQAAFRPDGTLHDPALLLATLRERRELMALAIKIKPDLARVDEQEQVINSLLGAIEDQFADDPAGRDRAMEALRQALEPSSNQLVVRRAS